MSENGQVILDIAGTELTAEDKALLCHPACAGIILFTRNYQDITQLKNLTQSIRQISPHALIAVDQEGGRVQRFREGFTTLPPFSAWGKKYDQDSQTCLLEMAEATQTLCNELRGVGVNFNLVPVLDLNRGVSEVIGQRSLHRNPQIAVTLAGSFIDHLHQGGFPSVGKHFPGHGAVAVDSHFGLPVDHREWSDIQEDLFPFVQLLSKLDAIMPAHIIFEKMDANPVTFSTYWLRNILRQQLNFNGLVISDDLSMEATTQFGSYGQRALLASEAGCDLLLVCNNRAGAVEALESVARHIDIESSQRIKIFKQKYKI